MTYENYQHWVKDRILKRAILRENGCIEYADGNLKHKYGLISITVDGKRKSVPAHRALYMAVHNCFDLPSNIYIRHKCDNPPCVNIKHLEKGTPTYNMQDCIERGRKAKKYKSHTRTKIHSEEKVEAIRSAIGKTAWIAQEFGVSNSYVSKIKTGKLKALKT
jgi:hypothetical protein